MFRWHCCFANGDKGQSGCSLFEWCSIVVLKIFRFRCFFVCLFGSGCTVKFKVRCTHSLVTRTLFNAVGSVQLCRFRERWEIKPPTRHRDEVEAQELGAKGPREEQRWLLMRATVYVTFRYRAPCATRVLRCRISSAV